MTCGCGDEEPGGTCREGRSRGGQVLRWKERGRESGVSLRKDQVAFIGVLRRQVQVLTLLVLRPHRKVPPSGQFRGNHCSRPVNSITLLAEFNDICSNNITLQVVECVESVVE